MRETPCCGAMTARVRAAVGPMGCFTATTRVGRMANSLTTMARIAVDSGNRIVMVGIFCMNWN